MDSTKREQHRSIEKAAVKEARSITDTPTEADKTQQRGSQEVHHTHQALVNVGQTKQHRSRGEASDKEARSITDTPQ